MVNLPKITDFDLDKKRVVVRADLDVPGQEKYRLEAIVPTLKYLSGKNCKITVIGHLGRPDGRKVEELKIAPVAGLLKQVAPGIEFEVWENLRFDPGEEKDSPEFARELADLGDFYVNEAFATSHRVAASITGLPKLLPHAVGFRFEKEVENLSKVFENPKRPVVLVVGGSKKDKLEYIKNLEESADKVLIGGRLPDYMGDDALESVCTQEGKLIIGNLIMDKEDITLNTIEKFEAEIEKAGTIVLAGPMGRYETEGHSQGTERIFRAVSFSKAFKITGGGDSLVVIRNLNLTEKFDWVSVGGGAMLEFLAKKTLPGIEAMLG